MPRSKNRRRKAKEPPQLTPKRRNELLAQYALKQLPHGLRSDVLTRRAPGEIGTVVSASVITIGGHTVPRNVLFETFRAAMRTSEKQGMAMKGARGQVTVDGSGRGAVRIRDTNYVIKNVDLAAEDQVLRETAVTRVLSETSLSAANVVRLRSKTASPLTEADFFAALEMLARSPAHIVQEFQDARKSGSIALDGFFAAQPAYLSQLLPEPATSADLDQYVQSELVAEFEARFREVPEQAFQAWTRLFGSRSAVAATLLLNIEPEALKRFLTSLTSSANPYATVGGIELCAALVADKDFVDIGRDLLASLVGRLEHIRRSMDLFAAVFCIALPRMRLHSSIRNQPAYWRRLAATAHASLILEAAGSEIPEQLGLLEWAISNTGSQFFLTCALEKSEQPRWQAEWIEPRILFSDLLGRISSLDDTRFEGWTEPVRAVRDILEKESLKLTAAFPSILEASLPLDRKLLSQVEDFKDFVGEVSGNLTPQSILNLRSLTYGYMLVEEVIGLARECMEQIERIGNQVGESGVLSAIKFAADVAVLAHDEVLARAAANALLTATHDLQDQSRVMEVICVLVICSQLMSDSRTDKLASWLMQLVRNQSVGDVLARVRFEVANVAELSRNLRPKLSRVIALAALGEN